VFIFSGFMMEEKKKKTLINANVFCVPSAHPGLVLYMKIYMLLWRYESRFVVCF